VPDVELLDKTEIWVDGVTLDGADLPALGRTAARVLSVPEDRFFVTDVRDARVVFAVLVPRVSLEDVAGKQNELLDALAQIAGVRLAPDAAVHSWGVLGVIGAPAGQVPEILARAGELEDGLRQYVAGRVAVVSTGAELLDGRVRDTNVEAATELLGSAGYEVASGGTLPDDERTIAGRVARLAGDGFGVVVTTGGVGAEDKDRTIEALQLLDPDTATAATAHYQVGEGRHVKDSVRIGVARVGWGLAVALPGPTHEVRVALPVLIDGLRGGSTPPVLAEAIAAALRAQLRGHP
jgi:molybdenum cofactor synthesis domain-containing protein